MFRTLFAICLVTTKLLGQLNSSFDEQSPVFTPDGAEVYFTVANSPLNVSGKRDAGDIWFSQFLAGKWTPPALANGLINNPGYNTVLGFSTDGREMFLYGHYDAKGGAAGSQGISVAKRQVGGWSLPKNEQVLYFQNKSIGSGGYISPDKTIFIFSADARGTHGNEDIYVSFNAGTQWTEPKNLGSKINTRSQELSPWLSADTKTLYFSTNHQPTIGSFDVFYSERLDDSWTNWSPPKNLGPSVNSPGKELFYNVFPDKIFYTSTHNSDGYGDIRVMDNPKTGILMASTDPKDELPKPKIEAAVVDVSKSSSKTNGKVKIFGIVSNSVTGKGIAAELVFHSSARATTKSSLDGKYGIELDPKIQYTLRIESSGFIGLFDKVDLTTKQVEQVEINFKLQPVKVGVSINLRNVLFKQSSSELLSESFDELDMVVEFLKTNPTVEIEVAGHTDNAGKADLNLKLSRERVARVKNYIVESGIDTRRIRGVGYGDSKPIASNKTDEGKKFNRRVEFKILKE